jgi:CRP-like cAMP-binding protein
MALDAIVAPFLRLEIFQGLKPLQITEIARRAERIVFRPGQIIVHARAPGDGAFVIVSGEAVALSGTAGRVEREPIEPGSLIGELAMLTEHDYNVTVVAQGPVRALKITRDALRAQMLDDPGLAEHLSARISARLRNIAEELRRIDSVLERATRLQVA